MPALVSSTIEHKQKTLEGQLASGRCVLQKDWRARQALQMLTIKGENTDQGGRIKIKGGNKNQGGENLRSASCSFLGQPLLLSRLLLKHSNSALCGKIANSVLRPTAFIASIHNHHPILAPRTSFPPKLFSPKAL